MKIPLRIHKQFDELMIFLLLQSLKHLTFGDHFP